MLSLLLEILEGHRISFSKGDDRFQTKRVPTKTIGSDLGATERYVRILENAEIIAIRRKRINRFMSLWNAFAFSGFIKWLMFYAQTKRTSILPKEEGSPGLTLKELHFPTANLCKIDRTHKFWRCIAYEVLPAGKDMPCLSSLSQRFRLNLRKHHIGHEPQPLRQNLR